MTIHEIKAKTMCAIEDEIAYKYVMKRIEERAALGYNHVKIDGDIQNALDKFSIQDYLVSQGYRICPNPAGLMGKIEWEFE